MSVTLPVELIISISTFLTSDKQTLLCVIQTCRAWHDACRPKLFHDMTWLTKKHRDSYLQILRDEPEIQFWVRSLTISTHTCPAPGVLFQNEWPSYLRQGGEDGLSDLPYFTFPQVHTLQIQHIFIPVGDPPNGRQTHRRDIFEFCSAQRFPLVKRLILQQCSIVNMDDLSVFMSWMPKLERITLDVQIRNRRTLKDSLAGFSRLTTLDIRPRTMTVQMVIDWVRSTGIRQKLTSIEIPVWTLAQSIDTRAFLHELGDQLRSLKLWLSFFAFSLWDESTSQENAHHVLDLGKNQRLKYLSLHGMDTSVPARFYEVLSSISKYAPLEEVSLHLEFKTTSEVVQVNFRRVDTYLHVISRKEKYFYNPSVVIYFLESAVDLKQCDTTDMPPAIHLQFPLLESLQSLDVRKE